MVMFRGRGGRGGPRGRGGPPHLMHSVPPMRLKPGRGLPPRGGMMARGGPLPPPLRAGFGGPPRPLGPRPGPPGPPGPPFSPEHHLGPPVRAPGPMRGGPPGPMRGGPPGPMRGAPRPFGPPAPPGLVRPLMGGPHAPPYAPRGAGGPPYRGRGRGGASRGRGAARGAKNGAAKMAVKPTPPKAAAAKVVKKTSRTEKERDANDLLKPWVTPELRAEINKKHEMHSVSRKSSDPKDFEAFKTQRNKVSAMLRAAKLEYIGLHEEEDVGKIMAEVGLIQAAKESEAAAATETKTEPKAENGAASEQAENGAVAEQAEDGTVAEPAENGAVAEQAAA